MDEKTSLFLSESRMAHDRLTNLLILTYPLLTGVWQFRETAKHFAPLADPIKVRDAVLSYIQFPRNETAIRRLDFTESVSKITWERQRDATAEMMFLVCCSIYENFTSHIQDIFIPKSTKSNQQRPIEKGLQFPSTRYEFKNSSYQKTKGNYSDNLNKAISHMPASNFMKEHLCQLFPMRDQRNILDDLEDKLHTYLLFKKLRNSIAHGRFDSGIMDQFKVVDEAITARAQNLTNKVSISTDGNGNYFVNLYNVIGFVALLLNMIRDIDFIYLLSQHGERHLIERLRKTKDAKQFASRDKKKELMRLKLCVQSIGAKGFLADEAARAYFVNQGAWRP